jgi:glycosyltransferase involved in cell wall biosynthesis
MRLLLINYEYPPVGGGAATATAALAREFVRLGHKVVILTGRFRDLPAVSEEDGVRICRVRCLRQRIDRSGLLEMSSFLAAGLCSLPGLIKAHEIEAAIAFFSLPSGPIALFGRWMKGIPYIVSLRGGDVPGNESSLHVIHRMLAPFRRRVLQKSLAIVANSTGLQKLAEAADRFPVRVIRSGVDCDYFTPAKIGRPNEDNVLRILFAGRLHAQKNLHVVLQQLTRLPAHTFEFHVVGDGPLKEGLTQRASALGLSGAVTWHGWLSRAEMPGMYQSSDCLVNPSLYEGMSNAVLEAMACGLPVLASKVAGNEELVVHGENGFLFELADREGVSSCLIQMRDADLRRRMSEKARATAVRLSWKSTALQYLDALSSVAPPASQAIHASD